MPQCKRSATTTEDRADAGGGPFHVNLSQSVSIIRWKTGYEMEERLIYKLFVF